MVALLAGCPDDPAPAVTTASAPAASASTPIAQPTASAKSKVAGLISEADFKALHELKGEDAPAARGEMIALGDGRAYLSLPKGKTPPLPAVVVIHEWWGLNQHVKHWADRLTEDGYATIAVDLYAGQVATDRDTASKLMKAVKPEQANKTLSDAYTFLGEDKRIAATKRASIGWCFGGKWSLELALEQPQLSAAVVYYGFVETDPQRLAKLDAPLLGIFGERDEGIDAKYVDKFKFGLEQAGEKDTKIVTFDAEHAFANPSSGRYDFESAEKAWAETRAFLAKHLR